MADSDVAAATTVTDLAWAREQLAQGVRLYDGGLNTVPELGLPSIHKVPGLRHLGFGYFRSPAGWFDPLLSPAGTRFYTFEPDPDEPPSGPSAIAERPAPQEDVKALRLRRNGEALMRAREILDRDETATPRSAWRSSGATPAWAGWWRWTRSAMAPWPPCSSRKLPWGST